MSDEKPCCDCENWRKTWDHIHAENFRVAIEQCDKTRIELLDALSARDATIDVWIARCNDKETELAAKDKRIAELKKRLHRWIESVEGWIMDENIPRWSGYNIEIESDRELLTQD